MLNKKYQSISTAIASYDYTDVQEGTGVNIYYGFSEKDTSGETYALSDQAFFSYTIDENAYIITNGDRFYDGIKKEYNFDLTAFNMPKRVRGTARVQNAFDLTGRDAEDSQTYIIYRIYHVDADGTETELGAATTETLTAASAVDTIVPVNIEIPLTSKSFKKGEILRGTMEIYASGTGTGTVGDTFVCFDPQNRDGDKFTPSTDNTIISRLEFHIPFDLDL